ncbi:hypothetical protein BY996DRAFT_6598886 [Phakopsora pachyrhizi]|nr:hypothetical protein BY996DRAFT_6598886 [Phakopsora pachyrhizi]
MRLREGPVFQGFERSSESRAFDGVAPEDDTVTDDRNNRERSRVRTSTNPVDEDVKNYSNGLMNGSNVIRSNGMNDMVTRTRVHLSLVVGHIGPYIPPETYGIIFEECKRLPGEVKHLIAPGPRHETCTVLQRSGGLKQQYELIPTQQDSPQSHQGKAVICPINQIYHPILTHCPAVFNPILLLLINLSTICLDTHPNQSHQANRKESHL